MAAYLQSMASPQLLTQTASIGLGPTMRPHPTRPGPFTGAQSSASPSPTAAHAPARQPSSSSADRRHETGLSSSGSLRTGKPPLLRRFRTPDEAVHAAPQVRIGCPGKSALRHVMGAIYAPVVLCRGQEDICGSSVCGWHVA